MYAHIQEVENQHWWYVARRKIIFDWVLRLLAEYPSPKILDVGCGTGYNLEYLIAHGYRNVVGLDFSTSALEFCRSRGLQQVVCADGTFPPFASASFDMITSLDMIEHVEDDAESLRVVVGVFPEPFLHGFDGVVREAAVRHAPGLDRDAARIAEAIGAEDVAPEGSPAPAGANVFVVTSGPERFVGETRDGSASPSAPVRMTFAGSVDRLLAGEFERRLTVP